ncbi:hypothetical protein SCALM49S_02566 [Streptomyces californicus]
MISGAGSEASSSSGSTSLRRDRTLLIALISRMPPLSCVARGRNTTGGTVRLLRRQSSECGR